MRSFSLACCWESAASRSIRERDCGNDEVCLQPRLPVFFFVAILRVSARFESLTIPSKGLSRISDAQIYPRSLDFPHVITPSRCPAMGKRPLQGLVFLLPAWSALLAPGLSHDHQLLLGAALVALLSTFGAGFVAF